MHNLFLFIRRFYPFFLLLLLEVVSLILISRSNTYHHSTFVNSANRVTGAFFERQNGIKEYFELKQVNEILEEENALLRQKLSNVRALADSSMIDTIGKLVYEFWPAEVINHSVHKKYNYFTLNVGSKDGIIDGMGVINSSGIVGTITNVSNNYAVGLSMLNKNTRTSVQHKKSGAIGLMRWPGNNILDHIVEDVTKTAKVEVGDTIVTSGYSTFYPKGIMVGLVSEASLKEGSNFFDIEVNLSNDILSLNKVYIVNHYSKQELDSLETSPE